MRVILLGPPGSGRSTQSVLLSDALGVPHVSTGSMLRDAADGGDHPHAARVGELMRSGDLVPDEIVVDLAVARLGQPDAAKGFVLDGFPRTRKQALALGTQLGEALVRLDRAVWLELPDARVVDRVIGRRMDPETGAIYHLEHAPPPPDVRSRLVQRDDDTREACARTLSEFHRTTAPLRQLYEDRDMLVVIDADGTPESVHRRIRTALGLSG